MTACAKIHPAYETRCQRPEGHTDPCAFPTMTEAAAEEARRMRTLRSQIDAQPWDDGAFLPDEDL